MRELFDQRWDAVPTVWIDTETLAGLERNSVSSDCTLGWLLSWQRHREADEWFRFHEWLSRQPPLETTP